MDLICIDFTTHQKSQESLNECSESPSISRIVKNGWLQIDFTDKNNQLERNKCKFYSNECLTLDNNVIGAVGMILDDGKASNEFYITLKPQEAFNSSKKCQIFGRVVEGYKTLKFLNSGLEVNIMGRPMKEINVSKSGRYLK